jgi:hypothetical protein
VSGVLGTRCRTLVVLRSYRRDPFADSQSASTALDRARRRRCVRPDRMERLADMAIEAQYRELLAVRE